MLSKLWDWLTYPFKIKSSAEFSRLLLDHFGGIPTSSGESVSAETSMQCAAVYACVNVLSESIAMLPLPVYRRDGQNTERATNHPLYWVLHNRPNQWQTSFEWRQMCQAHVLLRGNAYSFIVRAGSKGRETIRELIPIHPDNVRVTQDENYVLTYNVSTKKGLFAFGAADIFHLRGMSLDGFTGVTPITYVRESIGLAMAAEKHGARLFGNGARPSGVLVSPTAMKDDVISALRDAWQSTYGGANAGKVAVLHGGLDFKPISMTAEDAQFLETRKYQRSEIASLFRVPAHLINDLEKATFSNIEHLGMSFVVHSLQPWCVRWEQAIHRDLLRDDEKLIYFAEFLIAGLMRGDMKSRYETYGLAIQNGILCPNEARRFENMNPRPGGDEYLSPMNMRPSGAPQKEPANAGNPA